MKLYSYKGQEPSRLPVRHRLEDGLTITKLEQLSDETLASYGFIAVNLPIIDQTRQEISWNGQEYVVSDFTEEKINDIKSKEIQISTSVSTIDFFKKLKNTSFYKKIRKEASKDLKINILYTEFHTEIKVKEKFIDMINDLNKFLSLISFEQKEILELKNIIEEFNLNLVYNIPQNNEECYDFDSDSFFNIKSRPFKSWVWNGTKWEAPIPYPLDGNYYVWDEITKKWKSI